ncbi:MAG TPA: FHA domain-containing protein [Pyrinomonadaceae bacterium]|nr:FHA domain-containing protein [Pyrinomonadaceae bacterium]
MITCERCNTENLDGSQYCDECGAALGLAGVRHRKMAAEHIGEPADGVPARPASLASPVKPIGGGAETSLNLGGMLPVSESEGAPVVNSKMASSIYSASFDSVRVNGPHAKLVIHRGRSVGKEFLLNDDEAHIGRWDADGGIFPDVDLDADDPEAKVSRRHARIMRRNGQYFIEDLGSTNGTFINRGRRLLPGDRQLLHDGDEVIVGKTFLRFQMIK